MNKTQLRSTAQQLYSDCDVFRHDFACLQST